MALILRPASESPILPALPSAVRDVAQHHELLRLLTIKDLKIKYKASAIGLFWSLLNPLLMMLVYTAIFGTVFKNQKPQFPVYILSGLLAWNFFGTTLPGATLSVVGNANLVRKTRFPTSLLPLSMVLSGFVNFLISLVLLFALVAFYRHPLGWSMLLLPLLLVAELVFTAGLSLLLSSLNVLFRDIEHFLAIVLTVWFFATPIIYPREAVSANPVANVIIKINPMTWIISGYQSIFYGTPTTYVANGVTHYTGAFTPAWPNMVPIVGYVILALVLIVAGFATFLKVSRRFVEEV